jgi:serine/threonine protein kinase
MFYHGGKLVENLNAVSVGRIYRGYSTIADEEVIIKVDNQDSDLDHEVHILHQMGRNPRAVIFLEHISSRDTRPNYMILKSFGRPLTDYFTSASANSSFEMVLLEEIILSVDSLHSQSFIHCDLKPENFLVRENGRGSVEVKLCDFEGTVRINEPWKIYHPNGLGRGGGGVLKFSQEWASPEVHSFNSKLKNQCETNPLCPQPILTISSFQPQSRLLP